MWNLQPPPGFRGLHPEKPMTMYQRHLPHWRQDGATYFVTFRLHDSLPQDRLRELDGLRSEWERRNPPPRSDDVLEELARDIFLRVNRWLDQGMGSWKKYSSRWINDRLGRSGDLWQEESYDRIIRDEEHLYRTIQYIGRNPGKAGMARGTCPLWIRPEWEELSWTFERDEMPDGSRSKVTKTMYGGPPDPTRTAQESRPTCNRA